MLELVVVGSMLAGVMTGLSLVMRTARQSWDVIDTDYAVLHQMQAVSRHFVRAARESNGVAAIKADGSGITLTTTNGSTLNWQWMAQHSGAEGVILVSQSLPPSQNVLAERIDSIHFVGFGADGVTPTSIVDDIQVVQVSVTVTLPRSATATRTIVSKVWVRSW